MHDAGAPGRRGRAPHEVQPLEQADGVAQGVELAQALRAEVHEHEVCPRGQADFGPGITPVAGHDVGHVGAVRAGVAGVAAGWVIAERRARVRLGQRRVDVLLREQASLVVGRRRARVAGTALIPQRQQARRAVFVPEARVCEVEAPVADTDHDAATIDGQGGQGLPLAARGLPLGELLRLLGIKLQLGRLRLLEIGGRPALADGARQVDGARRLRADDPIALPGGPDVDTAAAHRDDGTEAAHDAHGGRRLGPVLEAQDQAHLLVGGAGFSELFERGIHRRASRSGGAFLDRRQQREDARRAA